jgi:hypothetical protein
VGWPTWRLAEFFLDVVRALDHNMEAEHRPILRAYTQFVEW